MAPEASPQSADVYLSLVVPLFNEELNVEALHREIAQAMSGFDRPYEVIYVDDGSADGTFAQLARIHDSDSHVRVLSFRGNFGQAAALSAGFDHAKGEVIVPLDGDLQNDPADIQRLVSKLSEGYDVVAGWRKNRQDPFLSRVLPSRIANWVIGKVTGVPLHDYGCTLKAYRASEVKRIPMFNEMHRFILLPAMAAWQGATWCEEVVNHRSRKFGKSKYGILKTFKVILDLIAVKFVGGYGTRPIYIFGAMSMLLMFGAFLSGAYVLYRKLAVGSAMVQNPILLLTVLLVVLSALFLSLGLTAELVTRLHQESNSRPMYRIKEKLD